MNPPEFNTNVISELLFWIEEHLEHPLLLDDVARKAGYSKWHLQRTFKGITGMALGGYIRSRRLCRAAIALRLTKQPILNIAIQYQFDSQQTFTRRFKAHFNITPAAYRRAPTWDVKALQPPLNLSLTTLPVGEIVALPALTLYGNTHYYACTLEEMGQTHSQIRKKFWIDFLKNLTPVPNECYALAHYEAGDNERGQVDIHYTVATLENAEAAHETIMVPAGRYARFCYDGLLRDYVDFSLKVYMYALPALGVVRRSGGDIEHFYVENLDLDEPPLHLRCEYLIPITD